MEAAEYTILTEISMPNLISDVNQLIKQGWQPTGGISIIIVGNTAHLYQAMILIK